MGLEGKPGDRWRPPAPAIVPTSTRCGASKLLRVKRLSVFDIEGPRSPGIASTKRIGSYEIWQGRFTPYHDAGKISASKSSKASPGKSVVKKVGDVSRNFRRRTFNQKRAHWLDQSDACGGL